MSKRMKAVAMTLTASIALAVSASSHAATERYTYRAGDSTSVFVGNRSPFGHIAPLGYFWVRPAGKTFTLYVDDRGTPDGRAVAVSVHTADGSLFEGCMPVRTTTTITGARPGRPAVVWIENLGPRSFPGTCTGMATAGIATLTGVL